MAGLIRLKSTSVALRTFRRSSQRARPGRCSCSSSASGRIRRSFASDQDPYKLVPDIPIPEQSVAEVAAALQEDRLARFIDCRSEGEQGSGVVEGSVNLPYPHNGDDELIDVGEWLEDVEYEEFDKTTKIFVGCRKGHRSAMACEVLIKAGFTDVTNMKGGMLEWSRSELPMAPYTG
jgi:rhodanese-related sulfurtransferase